MVRVVGLCLGCLVGAFAWANASVTGKVVSITTDTEDVVVRISNTSGTQTYKLCSSTDGLAVEKQKIKMAFDRGTVIKAIFSDSFDRCLKTVEIDSDSNLHASK
jgi:hypothetical protein